MLFMIYKKVRCRLVPITALLFAVLLAGFGYLDTSVAQTQVPARGKYAVCVDCHDYGKNHHPVDFTPPGEIPFPLYDGKVTCRTCHLDDHLSGGPNYLRGGPYPQLREICTKCHQTAVYAGINPHVMLDEDGRIRKIIGGKSICLICHATVPNPAVDRTEDVQFRADVGFLCWRCHQPMANAKFFAEHFLVQPPEQMRGFIEKNESAMNVLIPLVPRDRITCSTCHNPHQQGVIVREAAAKGADSPSRLRIPSPKLCSVCHPI